ncbi:hypothetical protein Tco_0903333 [Tanacetum coccineum]
MNLLMKKELPYGGGRRMVPDFMEENDDKGTSDVDLRRVKLKFMKRVVNNISKVRQKSILSEMAQKAKALCLMGIGLKVEGDELDSEVSNVEIKRAFGIARIR